MIVKCEICSLEFKTCLHNINRGKGRFCSRDCFNTYTKNKLVSKNCFYRPCEGCGKDVYIRPAYNRRFCSRSCWSKHRKYKPTKETIRNLRKSHLGIISKKKNGKHYPCPICGKETYASQSEMRNKTVKYCSHACAYKREITLPKGRKGKRGRRVLFPKTDESKLIRKSIEYIEWRKGVFERDNYTCQKCNIKGGKLHPHHIINFSSNRSERFNIDNGITLCEEHHREFHKLYGRVGNDKNQISEYLTVKELCYA